MTRDGGLEVSDRTPPESELRELFREQELRCGNLEARAAPHLLSLADQSTSRYARLAGSHCSLGVRTRR